MCWKIGSPERGVMRLEMGAGAQAEKPVGRKLLCIPEGSTLVQFKLHTCV